MRRKHLFTMTAALCVSACQEARDDAERAELVTAFERAESLDEKFEIYEKMYASERPPNLSLAPALSASGEEAYILALSKAQTAKSPIDVMASLEIIREFTTRSDTRCSDDDESLIRQNVTGMVREDALDTFIKTIRASCRSNRETAPVTRLDSASAPEGL